MKKFCKLQCIVSMVLLFSTQIIEAQHSCKPFHPDKGINHSLDARLDLILNDSIYTFTSSGFNDERDYLKYNDLGLMIQKEAYLADEDTEWVLQRKHTLMYDENGLFTEYLFQLIHFETNVFQNYRYHYHTFNDQDLMTEDLFQNWDWEENVWRDKWIDYFTYDNEGKPTEILSKVWNEEGEIWVNLDIENYSYNDDDQLAEIIVKYWNPDSEEWFNLRRYSYTYENGLRTEQFRSRWNEINENWEEYLYYQYSYDDDDYLIIELRNIKEDDPNQWIKDTRYIYSNDNLGNIEERQLQFWYQGDSIWNNSDLDIYYNSIHQTVEVASFAYEEGIEIYPNPASDLVHISNSSIMDYQITLVGLDGQLVSSYKAISQHETIEFSELPNGIYFLIFSVEGENSFVRKVIKK